jgi:hypothetical protein
VDGRPHLLLGAGQTRDYELALYVDEQEARRHFPALAMRSGGRTHAHLTAGDHAQSFVLWGRFSKQLVLRASQELPIERLRQSLVTTLESELGDKPRLRALAEELVMLLRRDLAEGEELVLTVDGDGRVVLEWPSDHREVKTSPKVVRALLGVWLGSRPVSAELRRALVDQVDQLAR